MKENADVVIVYNHLDVFHAAIAHFRFISVEYLIINVWLLGKWVFIRCKNNWPTKVFHVNFYAVFLHTLSLNVL